MRSLLTLLLVSTTTFNFAFADDEVKETSEEFAQVSTRNIPLEDIQILNEARCQALIDEDAVEIQEESDETQFRVKSITPTLLSQKKGDISSIYTGAQHWATFFSPDGRILELEDETQWLITLGDVARTAKWQTNDVVLIYPNKDFFWKTTNYKLRNLSTNEIINADLVRGPKLNSYYTRFVTAIDYYSDAVYLNDGTRWDATWTDSSLVRHWMLNDVVIIGSNNGWFSSSSPNILINVSLNQYIAAKKAY